MKELPDGARALLDGPNFAHLATLTKDGSPHVIAVWAGREGDRILIGTGSAESFKARNVKRDPRVAISIVGQDNPYKKMHMRGRVVETRTGEAVTTLMNALAQKHTGKPFPFPVTDGVVMVIEADMVTYGELPFEHAPG